MSKSTLKVIISAVLLLSVSLAILGFMTFKIISQGAKLAEQVETSEKVNAQETSYYRLVKIGEETAEDRQNLKKYFLADESNSIDFLNLIENLAPKAGVVLETNSLETIVDKGDDSKWISVSVSFSGSRAAVQNFIKILEGLPYVVRLTSVDISALATGEWEAGVTMQVMVLAYD